MLVVTTPILDGKKIIEYKGPVFAQVAEGAGFGRGMAAAGRAFVKGRSTRHEEMVIKAREVAVREIISEAQKLGANAIIDLTLDYEMMGGDAVLMFKGSGTAVVVE
ncbi:MAG: YbjQ family protein [Oscillospiraceae bacterium]|nr:YbjQ family protein [Oscillospiraceae bacterium]